MTYFTNFPQTFYKFGNESSPVLFKDMSLYTDVIDQIKDEGTTYQKYQIIENLRPDQVSYQIYGTTEYYWTFFLLNDKIRENGWPLPNDELLTKIKHDLSGTTLFTTTVISESNDFIPGVQIRGTTSGTIGTINHRHLDMGQIVVDGTKTFTAGEVIEKVSDATKTFILNSFSPEYLSARYYTDVEGNIKNLIDASSGLVAEPGAQDTEVTHYDHYINQNDELKSIKVFRKSTIGSIVSSFNKALES